MRIFSGDKFLHFLRISKLNSYVLSLQFDAMMAMSVSSISNCSIAMILMLSARIFRASLLRSFGFISSDVWNTVEIKAKNVCFYLAKLTHNDFAYGRGTALEILKAVFNDILNSILNDSNQHFEWILNGSQRFELDF